MNKIKIKYIILALISVTLVLASAGNVSAKAKKHTHTYVPTVVTEATCTSTGLEVYECSCGASYEREIREEAHDPVHLSEDTTVEIDEEDVYVCSICGQRMNVIVNGDVTISYLYDTSGPDAIVTVSNANGNIYTYRVFRQVVGFPTYSQFIADHGCSTCASTSVFTATIPAMRNYTPDLVISKAQKPVFGSKAFNKNFRKKMVNQRPVTLYGISKILKKYKVKYKYVYKYKYDDALAQIKEHLAQGKPVIINTRKKADESLNSSKWVYSVHTMVLIGLQEDGTALIMDSANQPWSGIDQRVKHCTVEEILALDWSSKSRNTSVYYNKKSGTGGYILID